MAAAIGGGVGGAMPAYSTSGPGATASVVGPTADAREQHANPGEPGCGDDSAQRLDELDQQIRDLLDVELASVWLKDDERKRLEEQRRALMQQRLELALQSGQGVQPCQHAQGVQPTRGTDDPGQGRADAVARAAVTSGAPALAGATAPSPAAVAATYATGASGGAATGAGAAGGVAA